MREDRILLRRLQQGNQEALRWIYKKYKDDLLTVAGCLVADQATAEDCLHDVFVGLAAGAAKLQLHSSLKGYLATCIANQARDRLRKNSRRVSLAAATELPTRESGPVTKIAEREEAARLLAALGELPYEQREVIVLLLQGGLKFREIARELGISINTALSRYRYGLDKLRTLLLTFESTM